MNTKVKKATILVLLPAVLSIFILLGCGKKDTADDGNSTYKLMFSIWPDRTSPGFLSGKTVGGNIYIFSGTDNSLSKVEFYLDDPTMTGTPFKTEQAPFSFIGTDNTPIDTRTLPNGSHTVTAAIAKIGGRVVTTSGTFTVSNMTTPAAGNARLLFKSGFEGNVTLAQMDNPYNASTSYQSITGADISGFTWGMPLRNSTTASFHHMLNEACGAPKVPDLNDFFTTQIQSVTGHDGSPTKALFESLSQKPPCTTQTWYEIYTKSPTSVSDSDTYIRYWMKLPEDIKTTLGVPNWRSVFFWKTKDTDYRIEAYVSTATSVHADGTPHFYIHGDTYKDPNSTNGYKEYWVVRNPDVRVPLGEWFLMEFFWHRSIGSDGRVLWAVNGQVVVDHYGPNMGPNNSHIDRVSPFGVYCSNPGSFPQYEWIDDFEVWDKPPCGSLPCGGAN